MKVLNKPTTKTKLLATVGVLFFLIGLGLGSYLVSYLKHKINEYNFTVSQSLAFGNQPVMVTFYTLAYLCMVPLVILRGGKKSLMYTRVFLLLLSYSLLITIIWITTYRDETEHYIFAGIIFVSNLLFQLITLYSFLNYSTKRKTLIGTGLLQVIIVILLLVFLVLSVDSKLYSQVFASFENVTVGTMGTIILALGFI